MNRLGVIMMLKSLEWHNKEKNHEAIADIIETVLREAQVRPVKDEKEETERRIL